MSKNKRQAILVAGLGYGDEGKGTTVDYLTEIHHAHTIIRYNGGSQALHHVVTPKGIVHGFSQFSSGSFHPNVNTYLSHFMPIDPHYLAGESHDLNNKGLDSSAKRIIVDRNCVVITPIHRIINQMLEVSRKDKWHGSCGKGVGQAIEDWKLMGNNVLLAGDLTDRSVTRRKLDYLKALKIDLAEQLIDENNEISNNFVLEIKLRELKEDCEVCRLTQDYYDLFGFEYFKYGDNDTLKKILDQDGTVIFEGAQGVLLDPRYGTPPYVTKTKTTFDNADKLLRDIDYDGQITKIGVMRAYSTRHGPGPFPTEDKKLTELIPEKHNQFNIWQGKFRIGYFDVPAIKYAIRCLGEIDEICVTNADRLIEINPLKVCTDYLTGQPIYTAMNKILSIVDILKYLKFLQDSIQARISIISLGPTAEDKMISYPVH